MAQHRITLLPGDGIGPEVTASVVSIIECAGVEVEWEKYFVGSEAIAVSAIRCRTKCSNRFCTTRWRSKAR